TPRAAGHGELVLVVDDEPHIRTMAKAALEAHGYRAATVGGGGEAVLLFRMFRGEVRVVLLDMMMPGMDGPATLRALRALDPGVRVIATSGLRGTGRVTEATEGGARAFLQKPYTDEQLLAALGEVLAGR